MAEQFTKSYIIEVDPFHGECIRRPHRFFTSRSSSSCPAYPSSAEELLALRLHHRFLTTKAKAVVVLMRTILLDAFYELCSLNSCMTSIYNTQFLLFNALQMRLKYYIGVNFVWWVCILRFKRSLRYLLKSHTVDNY